MRILALLSWYDESPKWLSAAVASCAAFCDHLVAMDGAYALYPEGERRSPENQSRVIRDTAFGYGLGLTLHEPMGVWEGNEVEKRAAMFRIAESVSEPDDWYFVIDADEEVTSFPPDLRETLASTDLDVGEVTFWERNEPAPEGYEWPNQSESRIRCVFRAIRGLTVVTKHYAYKMPDGRLLWGDAVDGLEPALDLGAVRVEHKTKYREIGRRRAQKAYYNARDQANLEGVFPR